MYLTGHNSILNNLPCPKVDEHDNNSYVPKLALDPHVTTEGNAGAQDDIGNVAIRGGSYHINLISGEGYLIDWIAYPKKEAFQQFGCESMVHAMFWDDYSMTTANTIHTCDVEGQFRYE